MRGKSDLQDAVAIARVVARGEGLSSPPRVEILRDLKLLTDHRDQLVRARTQLINRTHRVQRQFDRSGLPTRRYLRRTNFRLASGAEVCENGDHTTVVVVARLQS